MLTERELDVLLRRARGESQTDIAQALKITQGAVSQFEKNAQRKLADAAHIIEVLSTKGVQVTEGAIDKIIVYGGKK